MPFEEGNKAAVGANHKKRRLVTQKLIAELQDAEGAKLDKLVRALVDKAGEGDVQAIKEVFDRVEGKVPQAHIGGDEDDPAIKLLTRIERVITDPGNTNS